MTYQPSFRPPEASTTHAAEIAVLQFLQTHRQGLRASAELLGGADGRCLVDILFDEIPRTGLLAWRVRRSLRALIALLSLAGVHDPDSVECNYFAAIDPWDPRVEDICLLADGLREHLQALFDREAAQEKDHPAV